MLSLYTRHSPDCPKREDLNWRRCRCPKWINGTLDGQFVRKSAKTRSWKKPDAVLREWEASASPQTAVPVTIAEAVEAYLVDAKARELRAATPEKHTAWAEHKGIRYLKVVDLRFPGNSELRGKMRRRGKNKSTRPDFSGSVGPVS